MPRRPPLVLGTFGECHNGLGREKQKHTYDEGQKEAFRWVVVTAVCL